MTYLDGMKHRMERRKTALPSTVGAKDPEKMTDEERKVEIERLHRKRDLLRVDAIHAGRAEIGETAPKPSRRGSVFTKSTNRKPPFK